MDKKAGTHILVYVASVSRVEAAYVLFIFFLARFSRRKSLVDDCFIGHFPGLAICIPAAPDVHEGLGQIQASTMYPQTIDNNDDNDDDKILAEVTSPPRYTRLPAPS